MYIHLLTSLSELLSTQTHTHTTNRLRSQTRGQQFRLNFNRETCRPRPDHQCSASNTHHVYQHIYSSRPEQHWIRAASGGKRLVRRFPWLPQTATGTRRWPWAPLHTFQVRLVYPVEFLAHPVDFASSCGYRHGAGRIIHTPSDPAAGTD